MNGVASRQCGAVGLSLGGPCNRACPKSDDAMPLQVTCLTASCVM